jgi:hypothetical protein
MAFFFTVEFDCAAMGEDVAQATSAPTKRKFKVFWAGICFPPLQSPQQKPIDKKIFNSLESCSSGNHAGKPASRCT